MRKVHYGKLSNNGTCARCCEYAPKQTIYNQRLTTFGGAPLINQTEGPTSSRRSNEIRLD